MEVHFRKDLYKIFTLSFIPITTFLAIAFLWKWMDIPKTPDPSIWKGFPKEEVWRKFFSFSIPLIYGLFTIAYTILSKLIPSSKREDIDELYRFHRYDFLTYGLIPIFLLMMLLWRYLWDWYLWFGAFYLSVVFIKTAILSKAIYRWIELIENPPSQSSPHGGEEAIKVLSPLREEGRACPRSYQSVGVGIYIRWGLFLTSFLLYTSVSLWINYSISPTGDEQHYLMITHSLFSDRDFDLKNNIEGGDHRRFSWVYFPRHNLIEREGKLFSTAYNSLLCFLLLPGYALGSMLPGYVLGGRLGSLLTINLITAWLLLEIFLFTADISKSYRTAFISWAIVGFTSPVFFFSAQVYPEIAGSLVLVFTLRRLLNPEFRRKGLLVLIAVLILISLKMRFAPLALTLPVLWAFISYQRKISLRILVTGIGIIIFALLILFIDKALLGGLLIHKQFGGMERMLNRLIPKWENISAISGLIFDQEFGLLFYSPLYAFGLIGIPLFLSRYRQESIVISLPILIYTVTVINYHGYDWYGGWSLPSRYMVVITPLIGLIAGIILHERRGLIITVLSRSLWIWSVSIVFIMSLVTPWRYNLANGANILLRQIEELFSTRITRLFPSFISPTKEGTIFFIALIFLFIITMIGLLILKPQRRVPLNKNLKSFMGGLLLLLISVGLIIIVGRNIPTQQLEAENMRHTTGIQYRDTEKNVWVLRENGKIWDYVILPEKGDIFINILAGGQCNTGEAPHVVVRIEEKKIGEIDIIYGRDVWKDSYYTFKVSPTKGGMYPFSIELTNGLYDPRNKRFCGLYLDRIEFRR